ncbi:MAG: ABC transporter ATP-binding protein [Desulfuromonadales bacterium]
MTELSVQNLKVILGNNQILKGVTLETKQGEIVALLGPSGSGKTTLLRAIAGLEVPHQGSVRIGEQLVFDGDGGVDVPVEQRSLGFVFQSYALWPHRTVFENVAYGLKLRKVPKGEIELRVREVLANLGLADLGDRHPHQLSGGQQQRVALARSLVYRPRMILLDEPLSNLDAKLREDARIWLRQLIRDLNLSAVCVTHDQAEAMALADRIVLLKDGVIEQSGTPREMYGDPQTLFVAEFMGSNNRMVGKVSEQRNGTARIMGDGWSVKGRQRTTRGPGDEAVAVIRLECLRIVDGAGDNSIRLPLLNSVYLGTTWEYLFKMGDGHLRAYGDSDLSAAEYWVHLPEEHVWIF